MVFLNFIWAWQIPICVVLIFMKTFSPSLIPLKEDESGQRNIMNFLTLRFPNPIPQSPNVELACSPGNVRLVLVFWCHPASPNTCSQLGIADLPIVTLRVLFRMFPFLVAGLLECRRPILTPPWMCRWKLERYRVSQQKDELLPG